MRKVAYVLIGLVLVLGVAISLATPRELEFMSKYPLLKPPEGVPAKAFRGHNWLIGRPAGERVFTFKGDFKTVADEFIRELKNDGWTVGEMRGRLVRENGGGYVFKKRGQAMNLFNARSYYKGADHFIVLPSIAKKQGMRREDAEGWLTVMHQWGGTSGAVSHVFRRLPFSP